MDRAPLPRSFIVACLLALAPACAADPAASTQGTAAAKAGLPDRDTALAHKIVAEGGLLIDVRSKEEFDEDHAKGAVNIPVDEFSGRMAEVEKLAGGDKNKGIVVYCAMGSRAAAAKKMLLKAGFEKVTNVGGLRDWKGK